MRIPVAHLRKIVGPLENSKLPLYYLSGFTRGPLSVEARSAVLDSQIPMLEAAGVKEIEVVYVERVLGQLIKTFPEQYRFPYGSFNYMEMDKFMNALNYVNQRSKRERYIVSAADVYVDPAARSLQVIIEFGEKIDWKKWNAVKTRLPKNVKFPYRLSESGIIIFVDMRPQGADYLQRFYKNSDLVTSIVGRKSATTISVAPDFNRVTDVWTVDEPAKLVETYTATHAKLVIIGDALSEEYKKALMLLKGMDKYARFMLATNIDQSKIDDFLKMVKDSYNQDGWSSDEF